MAADDTENGSEPSSSPTVLNAVNSAIRTAKQAASMTDDNDKVLNNLSTSGVHQEGHANSAPTDREVESIVVAANNEEEIVGKANDSPLKA
eukprot:91523_1